MTIWNPFITTPAGRPIGPVAPPSLRVLGGVASAAQLAMAQQAYYRFCEQQRVSVVVNPIFAGTLEDGSRYRIVVTGPVTIMELWPAGGQEDRRSGIGIRLTTLDGSLVLGHIHADGTRPQPYILTPRVTPGTRKTTGAWKVRKVNGYSGGKAVWGDKGGKRFFAGVGGKHYDIDLVDYRSIDRIFGTNNRAYWVGEFGPGSLIYTTDEKASGSFRASIDTLPFTHRDTAGQLWIMQITPVFLSEQRLQLWGQPYDGKEFTGEIGDLLSEVPIPAGHTMVWQTLSVSLDGHAARMVFRKVGVAFSKVDLSISPTALAITSMEDVGSYTPPTSHTETTGNQVEGEYTRTTVGTAGWYSMPGGYGFDAKGNTTAFLLRETDGISGDGTTRITENRTYGGSLADGYDIYTYDYTATADLVFPARSIDYGSHIVSFEAGDETYNTTLREIRERWRDDTSPNGIRDRVRRTGLATTVRNDNDSVPVFVDALTDLSVTARYIHTGVNVSTTDYTFDFPPGGDAGTVDNSTSETTHSYRRQLKVVCRGAEVLVVDTPVPDSTNFTGIQYVALSAADPLTGAVCINILELDYMAGSDAPPLRSWIVLADDKGAKLLRDVLPIPDGTDVRIESDTILLSVP